MVSIASKPHASAFRAPKPAFASDTLRARLRLLQSGDGWSLVGPDGELMFHALGIQGRRRCLEYAYAEGALTISS
jgi:hypothetical protein